MKKLLLTALVVISSTALTASSALAFEGGGRKPSEAPLIAVGQHYTGQLNNHEEDVNYGSYQEVALWHLPTVTTRDVVTIDWHGAPYTDNPGRFPICMVLAQGINDFNWGTVFGQASEDCNPLSGSGSAHTEIVTQEANSGSSYLEFFDYAEETNPADYETYPYDFTVEPILHYLAVAMKPVKRVSASGIVYATANLASGLPAPDGLPFSLTVNWRNGGIATYTGISSGGVVGFQLALPETAYDEEASFVVSHPADGTYQSASAPKASIKVAKPKPPAPTPCELAQRRSQTLAKRLRQLKRQAGRASGFNRRRLNRRAHGVKRKLRAARRQAASLCT